MKENIPKNWLAQSEAAEGIPRGQASDKGHERLKVAARNEPEPRSFAAERYPLGRMSSHLRLFGVQFRTPVLLLAAFETVLLFLVASTSASATTGAADPALAAMVTLALMASGLAMGLHHFSQRNGTTGLLLRAVTAFGVLAPIGLLIVHATVPGTWFLGPVVAMTASVALVETVLTRNVLVHLINENLFKRRVLVLGAGREAKSITTRMRRRNDRRGFILLGFVPDGASSLIKDSHETPVLQLEERSLLDLCHQLEVDEIVIAWDDRRSGGTSQRMPLEALLNCKMAGVEVTELPAFFEREAGRIDIDVLRPSWLLFSSGFSQPGKRSAKRVFDLIASLSLLALAWPVMLATAIAIKLEDGIRGPVLYRQRRVGQNGGTYEVLKFRSMRTDAEKFGEAVWAEADDPRITRVGHCIRRVRIDELPQLFNILGGSMAFVGPRPERPVFVERLAEQIPFYAERHRVKPGLTGWAQINYPYGACEIDARRKLEYDLFYVKNYSLLLDLVILIRTVEVVLMARGAR